MSANGISGHRVELTKGCEYTPLRDGQIVVGAVNRAKLARDPAAQTVEPIWQEVFQNQPCHQLIVTYSTVTDATSFGGPADERARSSREGCTREWRNKRHSQRLHVWFRQWV